MRSDVAGHSGTAVSAVARSMAGLRRRGAMTAVAASLACAGGEPADRSGDGATELAGTAWRLEDLAGAGIVEDAVPTLEFAEEGRVSGSGSCNRFSGIVEVGDGTLDFGPLAATRMACAAAVNDQESRFFAALEAAERFELDGVFLLIHPAGGRTPLRFRRSDDPSAVGAAADAIFPRGGPTASHRLTGVWTVAGHWLADVSAMDAEEAAGWHGRRLWLVDWEALVPGARCAEPSYLTERVAADAFVTRFDSWPQGLVLPVEDGRVRVMTVRCEGEDWAAPGGTMIRVADDRALTPWDGAFFALDRDREAEEIDFRARGNEPGWLLEIVEGERIRFEYDYGADEAVAAAPEAEVDAETSTVAYTAAIGPGDLRVEIRPEPCADDMSGFPFPAAVTVTLGDRVFLGCGGPRPDVDG